MKRCLIAVLAGAALLTLDFAMAQDPTHYVYVVGGRETDAANVPVGETADAENFQNVLVGDLDIATKAVTNWRLAGDLPTEHPDIDPSVLHWAYLADNVNFYNNRIYVGPASFNGGTNTVTADFIAYADISPDGTLGTFSISDRFPSPPTNQRLSATEILVVDGVAYLYIIGGNQDEPGTSDRVLYAAIDENDGSLGAWQTASAALPSPEWFHAGTAYDGTLIVSDGNTNNGAAHLWTATPASGGDITSWATTTYTAAYNARWDNITVTASAGGNDFVYIIGGTITGVGITGQVDFAPAGDVTVPAEWDTTVAMPGIRRRMAGAAIEDVIIVPGGSTSAGFADGTNTVFVGTVDSTGGVTWVEDTDTNVDALPTNRSFHGVGIIEVPVATSVNGWQLWDY